ncbi:putative immunity protein [Gudongella sp. SC589]|uniref:putative immunity protein n=1 Tax=Gudongella sp. SC589 TaxID=3385990 RepID=UPI003904BDF7
MFKDVEAKIKKRNRILFSKDSKALKELVERMGKQNHRTLVLWALDCGEAALGDFEAVFPGEMRPRKCLESCRMWARGEIKMKDAKRAILDAHAVAKEIDDEACIALCHAIGHAGATVHVGSHAIGLPVYELTAIVISHNKIGYEEAASEKIDFYIKRLTYWQENVDKLEMEWADFLKRA